MKLNVGQTKEIIIGCLYRSAGQPEEKNYNICKMRMKQSRYFFVGDFNYKDINWKNMSVDGQGTSREGISLDTIKD